MTRLATQPNEMLGAEQQRTERNPALDALKGLLVLSMVLYHWWNYFVSREGEIYKYIRFITPSFVFITGFLLTNVYLAKYRIGDRRLHARLFVRGLKLLVLFTLLNLAANLVLQRNYNGAELGLSHFLAVAPAVYLSGGSRGAVFEVLVPISYLLIFSSVLFWCCKMHRHFLLAFWFVFFGGLFLLRWHNIAFANVDLFSMGVLGMAFGRLSMETIDHAVRPAIGWFGAYVIYLVALNMFDVIYVLQAAGLVLNLVLLYMAAKGLGETGLIARKVILLGQYSLLAYIAQIAILQALVRVMRPLESGTSVYALSLAGALVLTLVAVEATHRGRRRSPAFDRLYRFVFA